MPRSLLKKKECTWSLRDCNGTFFSMRFGGEINTEFSFSDNMTGFLGKVFGFRFFGWWGFGLTCYHFCYKIVILLGEEWCFTRWEAGFSKTTGIIHLFFCGWNSFDVSWTTVDGWNPKQPPGMYGKFTTSTGVGFQPSTAWVSTKTFHEKTFGVHAGKNSTAFGPQDCKHHVLRIKACKSWH